jgi:hypothetical protein
MPVLTSIDGWKNAAQTLVNTGQYLCVETFFIISASSTFHFTSRPPWRLEEGSGWEQAACRVALWAHICSGLSGIAFGEAISRLKGSRTLIRWIFIWFLAVLVQALAIQLESVPPLVKVTVSGASCILFVAFDASPSYGSGIRNVIQAAMRSFYESMLWLGHGYLLLNSGLAESKTTPIKLLLHTVAIQGIWQIVAWADGLHSGPMQAYGILIVAKQISHVVSVQLTWRMQAIGSGYASIATYFFFALSSSVYEPRVSYPSRAEDIPVRLWYAPRSHAPAFATTSPFASGCVTDLYFHTASKKGY